MEDPHDITWLAMELLSEYRTHRDPRVVDIYISKLEEPTKKSAAGRLFWLALENSEWQIAEHCLAVGYSPTDFSYNGPLCDIIEVNESRIDILQWLLGHGCDIEQRTYNSWTPLMAAVRYRKPQIVELLLKAGANVNSKTIVDNKETALMLAAATGDDEIVTILLNYGADTSILNIWSQTAEEVAAAHGRDATADLIRRRKADET